MPYDHAKFVQDATELRGLLGGMADGLSDRAVVERALEVDDQTIQPATKQYLKDQYGESAWASAGKGFVRSTMLDTVGDLVGLETSKYTETAPIQNNYNTLGRALGGVGGMLALQALPGIGQAATGGRIGAVALRAALQAGAGANQNWREQQDQMGYGDRLPGQYSPTSTAIAAATSGAGQLAGRYLAGRQDKAWEAGKELAKKAWVGGAPNRVGTALKAVPKLATSPALEAVPNVAEESAQWLGEGLVDDQNLSASGLATKAPLWQRLAMTGSFGAASDLGLNRGVGHFFPGTKAKHGPRIVKGDEIDPDNPAGTYEDLTNLKATPDANPSELTTLTGEVKPNQQPRPPLADDSHIPFQEINKERDRRGLVEAHNRALIHYGTQQLAQLEQDVEEAVRNRQPTRYLVERSDPNNPSKSTRLSVYRIGNEEIAVRPITDAEGNPKLALFNVTRDPEMGDKLDLRNQEVLQYLPKGKDRQHRAFLYSGDQHRALPGVGGKEHIEYTHEGQPYKVVTTRKNPDGGSAIQWIGGIPLEGGHVPAGMHRIKEFELDSLLHGDLQERLAESLAAPRAKRKGKTKKKVLLQEELLAIAEEQDPQIRNQAVRMLLQRYTEGGGGPIDLTDQGPIIPPVRGLPGDEGGGDGGGGGNGGSWPIPPPGSPGSGAVPPGATPTQGKAPTQLDPNQGLPGVSPETNQVLTGLRQRNPIRQAAEAAVQQGYPGTVEQAHADLMGRARELHAAEHEGDATTTGQGLLETIAELGGILNTIDPTNPGEARWAREFRDFNANQIGGVTGVFRKPTQQAGREGELSTIAGHTLANMAGMLQRKGFAIHDGGQLVEAIAQAKRDWDNGISNDFDAEKYVGGLLSMSRGEPWWGDGREIPAAPAPPRAPRAPRKPKAAPVVAPVGPSRKEQAETLLSLAGEAMANYQQEAGKMATTAKADTIYANRLGKRGIELALAEGLLDKTEATYYAKLLTKKF